MLPDTHEKLTFGGGILLGITLTVAVVLLLAIFGGCSSMYGQFPYKGPEWHAPYVRWHLFVGDTERRRSNMSEEDFFDRRIEGVLFVNNPTAHEETVSVVCRAWGTTPTRDLCILPKHTVQVGLLAYERDRLDPELCHVVEHKKDCK